MRLKGFLGKDRNQLQLERIYSEYPFSLAAFSLNSPEKIIIMEKLNIKLKITSNKIKLIDKK